jgi:SH3-like domain-containing protein
MSPAQATGDRVLTRQGANVRVAPNKDSTVQRVVPGGVVLQVYSRSRDGWVQVGDGAPWGWIYSSLLDAAP